MPEGLSLTNGMGILFKKEVKWLKKRSKLNGFHSIYWFFKRFTTIKSNEIQDSVEIIPVQESQFKIINLPNESTSAIQTKDLPVRKRILNSTEIIEDNILITKRQYVPSKAMINLVQSSSLTNEQEKKEITLKKHQLKQLKITPQKLSIITTVTIEDSMKYFPNERHFIVQNMQLKIMKPWVNSMKVIQILIE